MMMDRASPFNLERRLTKCVSIVLTFRCHAPSNFRVCRFIDDETMTFIKSLK